MYFDYNISLLDIVLTSALFLITLLLITLYRARILAPAKLYDDNTIAPRSDGLASPVSVIVYARDNAMRLEALLSDLLAQEYNAPFEVIVVNDSGGYECSDVVTRLSLYHTNLRITFVPDDAHNLSRKKLAITLGLKAARHPFVLLLNAECRLQSRQWLRSMTSDTSSITLGHAVITPDGEARDLSLLMKVDEAFTSIKWINAALHHHPYRGNGYNIGYPTATFFDHDGFAGTLNLKAGDDDMFIHKIANRNNTHVKLSADSIVHVMTSRPRELYRELKTSHIFTGRSLPAKPVMSSLPLLLWLSIAATAASFLSLPDILPATACVLMLLTQWIVISRSWARGSRALGITVTAWQVIAPLLVLPFQNLGYRIVSRSNRSQHYTWQKQKKT